MSDSNHWIEFEDKVRKAVSPPAARPEFVERLRKDLVPPAVATQPRLVLKPAWALALILLAALLVFSGPRLVKALQQLFRYVPGVGLVETIDSLRGLAHPTSLTRDGVTVSIENVFVYDDRVLLVYTVQGIDPANDGALAANAGEDPAAFCGGADPGQGSNRAGEAHLRLPDGSILVPDRSGLYRQNAYPMTPVFQAAIPDEVMEMTLVLQCIPWARLGAVPENWELPFRLTWVTDVKELGLEVVEVPEPAEAVAPPPSAKPSQPALEAPPAAEAPAAQSYPAPQVELALEKLVETGSNMIFYIRLDLQNPDPALTAILPEQLYVIDAQGAQIPLAPSGPKAPFLHHPGSTFEYASLTQPAAGPLTLVMENAILTYAPLHADPPQASPEALRFTFETGEAPQPGQTWALAAQFEIAGYPFQVVSARAVTWDEVVDPAAVVGSQGYDYGYQFRVQGDPRLKLSATLDIVSDRCGLWIMDPATPQGAQMDYTVLCREGYPQGEVTVSVQSLAVLAEGRWQATWEPARR